MDTYQDRTIFTRRGLLLAGAKLGIMSILLGRMYGLQILDGKKYKTLAENNRIHLRLMPPPRGQILDRNGIIMALNDQNFRALLYREQTDDYKKTIENFANLMNFTDDDWDRTHKNIKRMRRYMPLVLAENLSWEQVAQIELNIPDLPGVQIDVGEKRSYVDPETNAHLLGYVASASEKEAGDDPLLQLPGFKIGKTGIENIYEKHLRGTPGHQQLEVNAFGKMVREISQEPPIMGHDLKLTIDQNLQHFIHTRLADQKSASVVVMDALNGALYGYVSHPGYDPNHFVGGIPHSIWEALKEDDALPLMNKPIVGQYPPGSVFKMVVALAALETKLITPEQTIFCHGFVELGSHRFHCWHKNGGHGAVNLHTSLKFSCDCYYFELARKLSIDKISHMAHLFGLGELTGIDLPGEKPGLMPTTSWKMKRFGQKWNMGETFNASIGQGSLLATPLQLAVMTARLINGGYAVKPHLIPEKAEIPLPIDVNPHHLDLITKALSAVSNDPDGLAYASRIPDPQLAMGGKTATIQVHRITAEERARGVIKNQDKLWKLRDHGAFIGFAPIHAPRFVTAVLVEHGGGGSVAAAPIARDVLWEVQKLIKA